MPRSWIWLQLLLGWLPVGALFALMFEMAHGGPVIDALVMALQLMLTAALLGIVVYRFTQRVAWPHPLRWRFVATQLLAALAYAITWSALNVLIASLIASVMHSIERGGFVVALAIGPGWGAPYVVLGIWLYVMIAGIAYANHAAERRVKIEAMAARTQLAALRAQLHPHLLFNALHTVVQLIPEDPKRATRAAEELAAILRFALSEQRDVIPFAEEWAFVQRYLRIELLRFGERLRVHDDIDASALDAQTPAFALQTLVENAVRHAAAPRVEATDLRLSARCAGGALIVAVSDNGAGADLGGIGGSWSAGTGLSRLRERLLHLCGGAARLDLDSTPGRGFRATLVLPQRELRAAVAAFGNGDDQ
ncbi:MAG TPA: histidine kinase [Rudaea sp.]|jgi:signal transduction histidine kinase